MLASCVRIVGPSPQCDPCAAALDAGLIAVDIDICLVCQARSRPSILASIHPSISLSNQDTDLPPTETLGGKVPAAIYLYIVERPNPVLSRTSAIRINLGFMITSSYCPEDGWRLFKKTFIASANGAPVKGLALPAFPSAMTLSCLREAIPPPRLVHEINHRA